MGKVVHQKVYATSTKTIKTNSLRDTMLILHFIGLAMGLGTAFAHAFIRFHATKANNHEANNINSKALSRMGTVGLLLLIIPGVYLILPFWGALALLPLLTLKLVLVALLIVLLAMIHYHSRKALLRDSETSAKAVEVLGKISLTTTLTIVILAVLVFH